MKKMKGYIPTVALMLTMVLCTSAAHAGIIVSDRASSLTTEDPCQEKTTREQIVEFVTGLATFATGGIIVSDFVGSNGTCGIIVSDRTTQQRGGIIVSD